jgi:hypothetical protein
MVIDVRLAQKLNTHASARDTVLGIVMFVSPLWLNICCGKVCSPAPIVAEVRSTMDWKASRPTVVTESGSDTLVKLVEAKARWPMAVIPLPNVTDESVVTWEKASSKISVRSSGNVTLVRRVPRNAN